MNEEKTNAQLRAEISELKLQLEEANDTIEAIRTGGVDAFVVKDEKGHQLYTLQTADQTYRVLVEKMGEGAVTLSSNGIILYSNFRFAAMVGIPIDEVVGLLFSDLIFEIEAFQLSEMIWGEELSDYKTEVNLIRSGGDHMPVILSLTNLNLEEGTALSIIITDLSVQKETQRVLKSKNEELEAAKNHAVRLNDELEDTVAERTRDLSVSQEHFMLLANNIPQITWTNLPDGRFDFFNRRWYDYTGLEQENSTDDVWARVIHPDDLELTRERMASSLATGQVFELENRYQRTDGTYRWHLNRCVPLHNNAGELLFWVGTATDIDDQRKSIEKKDEFIGVASHELKTPLTSLKAYLQLITSYKKETVPAQVRTFIGKAEGSLNKLQVLVNDLLDVSKIQAGKLYFSQSELRVNELVSACVENAAYMFPDFEFSLVSESDLRVMGNAERLEQVLMNLINNGVKYSPVNKKINLCITEKEGKAVIAVRDFGIGLSDEQQDKIFERFYRVDDKSFIASGLGMGLYICMEIIKNHHGVIDVESKIEEGSTFYIQLPIIR